MEFYKNGQWHSWWVKFNVNHFHLRPRVFFFFFSKKKKLVVAQKKKKKKNYIRVTRLLIAAIMQSYAAVFLNFLVYSCGADDHRFRNEKKETSEDESFFFFFFCPGLGSILWNKFEGTFIYTFLRVWKVKIQLSNERIYFLKNSEPIGLDFSVIAPFFSFFLSTTNRGKRVFRKILPSAAPRRRWRKTTVAHWGTTRMRNWCVYL